MGRSIMRAVRMARSVGRPSRLKKPPGILPAAYIRSSTSTVSGKKSAPSRASARPWAVASTIVSPPRTTTAPSACFARWPVSKLISWFPIWTETCARRSVAILINCPPLCLWRAGARARPPLLFGRALAALPPMLPAECLRARSNFHPPCSWELAAQAELLDEGAVALEVVLLQIVQEAAAPPDELEQPAPRVVVVLVRSQVLGQVVDPLGQHRDLYLRRAGVGLAAAVLRDDLLLCFLGQGHCPLLPFATSGSAHDAASPTTEETWREPGLGRGVG